MLMSPHVSLKSSHFGRGLDFPPVLPSPLFMKSYSLSKLETRPRLPKLFRFHQCGTCNAFQRDLALLSMHCHLTHFVRLTKPALAFIIIKLSTRHMDKAKVGRAISVYGEHGRNKGCFRPFPMGDTPVIAHVSCKAILSRMGLYLRVMRPTPMEIIPIFFHVPLKLRSSPALCHLKAEQPFNGNITAFVNT